jgi:endonuclease III
MKVLSINNLLYIFTFVLTTFLSGQNTDLSVQRNTELSHFESYKTFGGRAFNLYKDLVTENLVHTINKMELGSRKKKFFQTKLSILSYTNQSFVLRNIEN